MYPRDLPQHPSAASYGVTPPAPPPSAAGYMDPPQWLPPPHEDTLSLKPTDPYPLHSEEVLSSGSLKQDSLPDQQFLSAELAGSLSSGYAVGVGYQPPHQADSLSSTSSTGSSNGNATVPPTAAAAATTTTTAVKTEGVAATPTTTPAPIDPVSDSQELKAEIERLKEQLRKKEETIQQQSVQLHYTAGGGGGVSTVARSVVQHPAPVVPANMHYSTPHHPPYGNGGVVLAPRSTIPPPEVTPTYSTLPQATPTYAGTMQYSNKQLHAAAAIAASIVQQQGSHSSGGAGGYYPTQPPAPAPAPAPSHTPQHQWSGPQAVVPPYQAAHTLVQLQPSTSRQPAAFLVSR